MRFSVYVIVMVLFASWGAPLATGQTSYSGGGFAIPDNDANGASSIINVPDNNITNSFRIGITMSHTQIGDLVARLQHGATTVFLFRQVGWTTVTPGPGDTSDLGGTYDFFDTASVRLIDIAMTLSDNQVIPSGSFRATNNTFNGNGPPTFSGETVVSLDGAFVGTNINGAWTLTIADIGLFDTGSVSGWSVTFSTIPEPTTIAMGLGGVFAAVGIWRYRYLKRGAKEDEEPATPADLDGIPSCET